ncbi:MAG: LysM peptidoglycan-binding domain-containing protein [Clostridia bacterium]|nr:LysM peptidoglycan-binding domain-containing protein [Clostridia bacterium]
MRIFDPYEEIDLFVYVCKNGESVGEILNRFRMTEADFYRLNGICSEIKCGDKIIVKKRKGETYRVRAGDSVETISKAFGIDGKKMMEDNGINCIFPTQILFINR